VIKRREQIFKKNILTIRLPEAEAEMSRAKKIDIQSD
jgi:hypothetical protein